MKKNICLLHAIEINTSPEKIFDYISDLNNDPKWRPEVAKMEVHGEKTLGTQVTEYITVYRYFKFTTPTILKVLDRPTKFIAETPDSHPTWVECIRTIETLENGKSKFTVQLSFSLDNMLQILPFIPPAIFIQMWYARRMKRYLKNLKGILETEEQ